MGELPANRRRRKGLKEADKKRAPGAPKKSRGKKGVGGEPGGVSTGGVTKLTPQEQQELDESLKELRKQLDEEDSADIGGV
ncbi:unnamed protein product [marine sediment metagenome]|uniref:Uncharacterized protein n=1 Tax=marine sediment metagenome TaxID=412755 RepID=X1M5U8_9ZZZZ